MSERFGVRAVHRFVFGGDAHAVLRAITESCVPERPVGRGWECVVYSNEGVVGVVCTTSFEGKTSVRACFAGDVRVGKLSLAP